MKALQQQQLPASACVHSPAAFCEVVTGGAGTGWRGAAGVWKVVQDLRQWRERTRAPAQSCRNERSPSARIPSASQRRRRRCRSLRRPEGHRRGQGDRRRLLKAHGRTHRVRIILVITQTFGRLRVAHHLQLRHVALTTEEERQRPLGKPNQAQLGFVTLNLAASAFPAWPTKIRAPRSSSMGSGERSKRMTCGSDSQPW